MHNETVAQLRDLATFKAAACSVQSKKGFNAFKAMYSKLRHSLNNIETLAFPEHVKNVTVWEHLRKNRKRY